MGQGGYLFCSELKKRRDEERDQRFWPCRISPPLVRSSRPSTTRYRCPSDRPPVKQYSAQYKSFEATHHSDIELPLIMPRSRNLHGPRRIGKLRMDISLPHHYLHLFTRYPSFEDRLVFRSSVECQADLAVRPFSEEAEGLEVGCLHLLSFSSMRGTRFRLGHLDMVRLGDVEGDSSRKRWSFFFLVSVLLLILGT